ncbi:MAG: ATP:cob(I)alamin adenosyltransferase, partial [Pseudomonadota bacterium]
QDLGYEPLRMTAAQTDYLEKRIDFYNEKLTPLTSFILPGGTEGSSYIHLARAIARRAETHIITLSQTADINIHIRTYINRLSDYLFVIGRILNDNGRNDVLWVVGQNR